MSGIFLILVVGLWLWACIAMTRGLLRRWKGRVWAMPAACVAFTALLVAPVSDEIVGGFQFRALCEKNAVLKFGVEQPEGLVTKLVIAPTNEIVPWTAIVIRRSRFEYFEAGSDRLVVAFDRYSAKGGYFVRALGISQGNAPLTLGSPSCSPESARGEAIERTLKFSVIN